MPRDKASKKKKIVNVRIRFSEEQHKDIHEAAASVNRSFNSFVVYASTLDAAAILRRYAKGVGGK